MARIDHRARPAGPPDDDIPPDTWRRRLARFWVGLQDWLWNPDERFAADRCWTTRRSRWGGSIKIHNPAFGRRRLCFACDGTGHHRIAGADCEECDGTGVVTLPDPDDRGEPR